MTARRTGWLLLGALLATMVRAAAVDAACRDECCDPETDPTVPAWAKTPSPPAVTTTGFSGTISTPGGCPLPGAHYVIQVQNGLITSATLLDDGCG